MVGGPVEGGGEAGAAVELALVAAGCVPLAGGLGEVAAQAAALAVLLDPFAQARPFAKQGFVGDLDGAFADTVTSRRSVSTASTRARPRCARRRTRPGGRGGARRCRLRPRRRGAAGCSWRAVARSRRAGRRRLRRGVRRRRGRRRTPGRSRARACGRCVSARARAGWWRAAAGRRARPRRRQQAPRRAAGSTWRPARRPAARWRGAAPPLHRPDEDVVGAQQLGQRGVGSATSVEIGPGRDDHHSSLLRVGGSSDERLGEVAFAPAPSGRP